MTPGQSGEEVDDCCWVPMKGYVNIILTNTFYFTDLSIFCQDQIGNIFNMTFFQIKELLEVHLSFMYSSLAHSCKHVFILAQQLKIYTIH